MTTKGSNNPFPSILLQEVATDGSDTPTPAADYRRVFLGEDGELHLIDSADVVTDVSGAAGSVATDTIWDAAGDLAVGSGANTAARLAMGAEGSALSVMDGVVGWNAATSMPSGPTTNQRVYRTDLGIEFYFDGTRWLCTCPHELAIPEMVNNSASPGTSNVIGLPTGVHSIYITRWQATSLVLTTNDGSNFWTMKLVYKTAPNTDNDLTGFTFTTAADTVTTQTRHNVAPTAVTAASTFLSLYHNLTKTGSPGNSYCSGVIHFRYIGT